MNRVTVYLFFMLVSGHTAPSPHPIYDGAVGGCAVSHARLVCLDEGMGTLKGYLFPAVREFYQLVVGWAPELSQLIEIMPQLEVSILLNVSFGWTFSSSEINSRSEITIHNLYFYDLSFSNRALTRSYTAIFCTVLGAYE